MHKNPLWQIFHWFFSPFQIRYDPLCNNLFCINTHHHLILQLFGKNEPGRAERDLITLQSSSHVFAFTLILCKPAWCSTLIKVLGEIFCRSCFAVIRGAVKLIAATIKNLREWIRSYTKFFYIDFRDRLMDDEETENVLLLSICQKHTISE